MRRVRVGLPALVVAAVAAVAAATTGAFAGQPKPSPPVIHESFTPLPCTGKPATRTTLEQEGCAEQQILATDKKINSLSAAIFKRLLDDAARRRFNAGARAWLAFRKADCLSQSDLFEGGTEAGVVDADCTAERNSDRVKELSSFLSDLSRTG